MSSRLAGLFDSSATANVEMFDQRTHGVAQDRDLHDRRKEQDVEDLPIAQDLDELFAQEHEQTSP